MPSALEAVELLDKANTNGAAGEVPFDAPAQTVTSLLGTAAGLVDLDDGDLRIGLDTRSMYAAALDWLGGGADLTLTDDVLDGTYDRLGLIN